jgi:hypothetical protein
MAWTSDAKNTWASRWLQWPEFARFWAQLVKRTSRPAEDPDRQLTVQIEGDQARITLDAQTGSEQANRHYVNFLPTEAIVVDPRGNQSSLPLPQVAPGRYQNRMRVQTDGVYTLTATQVDPSGQLAIQSGGFVVPYSPEYRLTGTDQSQLAGLVRRTGGRFISDPSEAFAHTLPSAGAPQPLWPPLLALIAVLVVADIGVRRVRLSGPELRAGYLGLRRRLGYVDDLSGLRRLRVSASRQPPAGSRAAMNLVSAAGTRVEAENRDRRPTGAGSHSGRLLAAKRRAARR